MRTEQRDEVARSLSFNQSRIMKLVEEFRVRFGHPTSNVSSDTAYHQTGKEL